MKMKSVGAVLIAVVAVLAGVSRLRAGDDDGARETKARKMIVASGEAADASRMCGESLDKQAATLPPEYVKRFKAAADAKAFEDMFVPIYAKNFTEEELDAIIAFYESPAGKKLVKKRMKIQKEAGAAGAAWAMKTGTKIMAELNKKTGDDDDDDKPAPKKKEDPKDDPK